MLELTEISVLTLHLLAVDVATIAPLLCIWLEWRESARGDLVAGRLGRTLADWSLILLAVGIALGLIGAGLLWAGGRGEFFDALRQIPARRLWFGVAELAFYVVCMLAYRALWDRWRGHRFWHRVLAVLAATNLMYHFPPLFTVISILSARPDLWGTEPNYLELMVLPESVARIGHQLSAAVVVTGVAVMFLAVRRGNSPEGTSDAVGVTAWCARLALVFAVVQIPTGTYLLVKIPRDSREQLLGGDPVALGLFAAAVIAALWLMHTLAAVAWGETGGGAVWRCAALTVIVFLLMAGMRHRARLAPSPGDTNPTVTQRDTRRTTRVKYCRAPDDARAEWTRDGGPLM